MVADLLTVSARRDVHCVRVCYNLMRDLYFRYWKNNNNTYKQPIMPGLDLTNRKLEEERAKYYAQLPISHSY